jgi:hypothetical protein
MKIARVWSFLVVSKGNPFDKSNLNCRPKTERVPVPVLSVLDAPVSRMSSMRLRYCFICSGISTANKQKYTGIRGRIECEMKSIHE